MTCTACTGQFDTDLTYCGYCGQRMIGRDLLVDTTVTKVWRHPGPATSDDQDDEVTSILSRPPTSRTVELGPVTRRIATAQSVLEDTVLRQAITAQSRAIGTSPTATPAHQVVAPTRRKQTPMWTVLLSGLVLGVAIAQLAT